MAYAYHRPAQVFVSTCHPHSDPVEMFNPAPTVDLDRLSPAHGVNYGGSGTQDIFDVDYVSVPLANGQPPCGHLLASVLPHGGSHGDLGRLK